MTKKRALSARQRAAGGRYGDGATDGAQDAPFDTARSVIGTIAGRATPRGRPPRHLMTMDVLESM